MVTPLTSEVQDAHAPFIPDDEFFGLNPGIDLRIRFWRDEDEDRVKCSPGWEKECFWIVCAWRDGTFCYKFFLFYSGLNIKQRKAWFKRFVREFYDWVLLIMTSPYFRRLSPQW